MKKKILIIPFLFLVFTVYGQKIFTVSNNKEVYIIGNEHVKFIEDPKHLLSIQEMIQGNLTFQSVQQENPSFGVSSSIYWLHFRVQSQLSEPLFIRIINPLLKEAELFAVKKNEIISKKQILSSNQEIRMPYSSFQLPEFQQDTIDFYLRCEADVPMIVPIRIFSQKAIPEVILNHIIPDILVLGAILMMMFYNLFIGFSTLNRSYIIYFFYSALVGLTIFFLRGYGPVLLGEYHGILDHYFPVYVSGVTIFLCWFAYEFLQLNQYSKKIQYLLFANMLAQILIILVFLAGYLRLNVFLFQLFNPVNSFIVIGIGIYTFKKGFQSAKYFIVAFGTYVVCVTLMNLTFAGILPFKWYSLYFLHIGSTIELLLFSIALADKINLYRKQKEEAQKETIELVQNQNVMLEKKVAERTLELKNANDEIHATLVTVHEQKQEIEKNHDNITASITYASRIQEAVLNPVRQIQQSSIEADVLFLPCDIVSGDYYWFSALEKELLITVADCTGHGVPGAFMSMLGMTFLNEIVNNNEVYRPDLVLNQLREKIKKALHQNEADHITKDGMDISLCRINYETGILQFSGAYNSMFIVRNHELIELKADRQPVGVYIKEQDFTIQEFQLQKNDLIYLFSDGYISQMGGEKGEKFKSKRLKELLLQVSSSSVTDQIKQIHQTLVQWQGPIKQIDDVTALVIKYKG